MIYKKKTSLSNNEDNFISYIFILPALILFFLFSFIPILYSFYISLVEWDGFSPKKSFIGFKNYIDIIVNPAFYNSLRVTLLYTLIVIIGSIIFSLLLANLLNNHIRLKTFFRTLYFIPVVTATVAAGIVWKYLLDDAQGIVNKFLNLLSIDSIPWLSHPIWVVISISIVGIWKRIGFNMVIYLAALQNISPTYYEAADIDGASKFNKFRYITVPLLKPTTILLSIMGFIDSFQVFDQVYVMTMGGPMGYSDVLGLYMFREGFRVGHMGYASAVGWIIFLLVFGATYVQFKISNKGDANYA